MSDDAPHSILWFGPTRDAWWNADFLALIADRAGLRTKRRVLDVGSGFGHFGRALAPHLARPLDLTGVDPERVSNAEATRRGQAFLAALELPGTMRYVEGRVEALPFPDASFELVIAQTVLMHVPDPAAAVREMARVLASGGVLLLAEPNNIGNGVARLVTVDPVAYEELAPIIELELRCHIGKRALGEGFDSIGEVLGGLVDPSLFEDVRFWNSDKATALAPPYSTEEQRNDVAELEESDRDGRFTYAPDVAKRYYLAGGGTAEAFERHHAAALAFGKKRIAAIRAGRHYSSGPGLHVVMVATRR